MCSIAHFWCSRDSPLLDAAAAARRVTLRLAAYETASKSLEANAQRTGGTLAMSKRRGTIAA